MSTKATEPSIDAPPVAPKAPPWRVLAAYVCLSGIGWMAHWWTRFAEASEATEVAAATAGYSVTLVILAGCLVALLIGIYDLGRLRYLVQAHESTAASVARTDADVKIVEGY